MNQDSLAKVGHAEVIDALFAGFDELNMAEGEGNAPPHAGDDSFYVRHDTQLTDTVSSNDWDMDGSALSFSLVSGTGNGVTVHEAGIEVGLFAD